MVAIGAIDVESRVVVLRPLSGQMALRPVALRHSLNRAALQAVCALAATLALPLVPAGATTAASATAAAALVLAALTVVQLAQAVLIARTETLDLSVTEVDGQITARVRGDGRMVWSAPVAAYRRVRLVPAGRRAGQPLWHLQVQGDGDVPAFLCGPYGGRARADREALILARRYGLSLEAPA